MKRTKRRTVQTNRRRKYGGSAIGKCIGVIVATILILAAVLGSVGTENLRNLLTMRADAADTATIEMYVNRQEMTGEGKGNNVHLDLARYDEVFTYDIQAFITSDASTVEITCQLDPVMEVALPGTGGTTRNANATVIKDDGSSEVCYAVLDGWVKAPYGDAAPGLNEAAIELIPVNELICIIQNNTVHVSLDIDNSAISASLREKWINLTFDAKIKNQYTADSAGAAAVMANIGQNTAGTGSGLKSHAAYTITSASPERGGSDTSDEVTVMPASRTLSVSVELAGNGEEGTVPDAETVRSAIDLFLVGGEANGEDRNVTETYKDRMTLRQDENNPAKWTAEWTGLPVFNQNTEYVVKAVNAETGTYSAIHSTQTTTGSAEPLKTRGGVEVSSETMTLQNEPGKIQLYATVEWKDVPGPKDTVTLKVIATPEGETSVGRNYVIDRAERMVKIGDEEDTDSSVTIREDGRWSVVIGGLPEQTDDGKRIDYTIEAGVPASGSGAEAGTYQITQRGTGEPGDPFEITYSYTKEEDTPTRQADIDKVSLQVNGAERAELKTLTEVVTYTITTWVPDDGVSTLLTVTDDLKECMQFAGDLGDVKVKLEDDAAVINTSSIIKSDQEDKGKAIQVYGQSLNVRIPANPDTMGKKVTITFKARIRDGLTRDALSATYTDAEIPNEAYAYAGDLDVPNRAETVSETVMVVPGASAAPAAAAGEAVLTVNGIDGNTELSARDDLFTYRITTVVPDGAKSLQIVDTLEPVLKNMSVTDDIEIKFGDAKIDTAGNVTESNMTYKIVAIDGQTLRVRVPLAEDGGDAGKQVTVSFKAMIRSDMDLSDYANADGRIPNEASVIVDNDTANAKKSKKVTVRPPDKPGVTKTVNGVDAYTLENDSDVLSYNITARIPQDAVSYTLTDNVPAVLEIKSATATVDGESMGSANLKTDEHEVMLTLPDATAYLGKTVEMTVKAKLLKNADLALYNNYKVPNTVTVSVNGRVYETSEPATVDGQVLGQRRRGGQTGEENEIPRYIAIVAALIALIVLAKNRIRF